jgi:hypothetical protein
MRIVAEYPDLYDDDQEESADPDAEEAADIIAEESANEPEENETEEEPREVKYDIAGVWDEIDSSTGLPYRNTYPLATMRGVGMELCAPVYSDFLESVGDMRYYDAIPISPNLEIEDTVLPEGQYRIRYSISDMLGKTYWSDFFYLTWDGEQAVFEDPNAAEEETEEHLAA